MNRYRSLSFILALSTLACSALHAAPVEISGPAGSGRFGERVIALKTGRVLVIDSLFDDGATADVGAVYLFQADGTLISTLKGSTAGDKIGGDGGIELANGNVVLMSLSWDNGAVVDAGAITLINGVTGVSGIVSPSNSVVGGVRDDFLNVLVERVGSAAASNYVLRLPRWNNGAATDAGAARFCSGSTPAAGLISAANALVGSTANDKVGDANAFTLLDNGNYVISSPEWDNGAVVNAGASTFGNGSTGVSGVISASNSLIGTTANDGLAMSVTKLTNDNYIVARLNWSSATLATVGAVTWCRGTAADPIGVVSSANSFVGATANDQIGRNVRALTNGHYVVGSTVCDNGAFVNAGAVAWGDGTIGLKGVVGIGNALMGNSSSDGVGNPLVALTNGNYAVGSPNWRTGAGVLVGAVTWCVGTGPTTGLVTAANSLIGSTAGDTIGSNVVALTNGNYVTFSLNWDNGALVDASAATLCNGTTGTVGVVSPANSLVGKAANESIGGIQVLSNGNYVLRSTGWDNGAESNAGAIVWCSGTSARPVGIITPANAVVGTESDDLSSAIITVLPNGNYVIRSAGWNGPGTSDAGVACWCNGSTGRVGPLSASNALVGTQSNNLVGVGGISILTNGNYVVRSRQWDNGLATDVGAATWGSGTRGIVGAVSPSNSLVGSQTNDSVAFDGVVELTNGNYVVRSGDWSNGAVTKTGALTFGNGTTGTSGVVSPANSIVGSTVNDNVGLGGINGAVDDGSFLGSTFTWDNGALRNAGAAMLLPGTAPFPSGVISASNAVVGNVADPLAAITLDYESANRLFVVGKGAENKVVFNAFSAGKVGFASPLITLAEGGNAGIIVTRTGGTEGTVTVNLSTTAAGSTATAGTDFIPVNTLLTFGPGVDKILTGIPTFINAPTNEPNELIKVVLSGGTATLGTPSTMFVRIVDADDSTAPGAPVITAPAANARVGVDSGDTMIITGTAVDNRGIALVEVRLNGGTFQPAVLTGNIGTSAVWSIKLQPQTGANLIEVRSSDTKLPTANVSSIVSRSVVVTRPLEVRSSTGSGTFTTGFAPRSFREVGKLLTITATPPSGFLFNKWIINGGSNATASEIGITAAQLELPTLSFIFRDGLTLTAEHAPNPFINPLSNPFIRANLSGIYNGLIRPDTTLPDRAPLGSNSGEDGTAMSNSTLGFLTLTALSNATFTGKLSMDGLVLSIAGSFDGTGTARFGPKRDRSLFINRINQTPLKLQLTLNIGTGALNGTVSDLDAVSNLTADRVHYSTTTLVPPALLGPANANMIYNLAFLKSDSPQPSGVGDERFPQGSGPGTATLTKTGSVAFAATLPDGTPFTSAAALNQVNVCHLFKPLYPNRGFIAGSFTFNTGAADTDVSSSPLDWVRPPLDDQHYPTGWPEGIAFQAIGTQLILTPGSSVLPGLPVLDADGNAKLEFGDGLLPSNLIKPIGITATDAVQKPLPVDASFTLLITHASGKFSGSFTHPLGSTPYQGIILQKGDNKRGLGFFKTKSPTMKDYLGQAGSVLLVPQ